MKIVTIISSMILMIMLMSACYYPATVTGVTVKNVTVDTVFFVKLKFSDGTMRVIERHERFAEGDVIKVEYIN